MDLAPENRARVPSMPGFDPICTEIVDCIFRCFHKIRNERDIGLIHRHSTHKA
jgi:hypothetical protein